MIFLCNTPCIKKLKLSVFSFISDLKRKEAFKMTLRTVQRSDVAEIKGRKVSMCNLNCSQRIPSCRCQHKRCPDRRHLAFVHCHSLCTQSPMSQILPGSVGALADLAPSTKTRTRHCLTVLPSFSWPIYWQRCPWGAASSKWLKPTTDEFTNSKKVLLKLNKLDLRCLL